MFRTLSVVLVLLVFYLARNWENAVSTAAVADRPNFLIIVTDDQRYDTLGSFMPRTQARIFNEGVQFTKGYVTTPLCCPSRASILTGMYAHRSGVRVNSDSLQKTTFADRLHKAGYFTGLVGKYLNSWDGSPRPEFDFWAAFAGGGSRYFNPRLNVNGSWSERQGYMTYLLRDYALRFLNDAARKNQPFALIFAPNAPHAGFDPAAGVSPPGVAPDPAPGDENLYKDLPPHRPPNYNEKDLSDKPKWLQSLPPLTPAQQKLLDTVRLSQLQALQSLDQAIGSIVSLLERLGKLDNTVIFYISDNGFFWGEHRLREKERPYEPSIRVPFALRYPKLVPKGRVEGRLVANIDIAPTIYHLAGLPIPVDVDGNSLMALLEQRGAWRDELLIEAWPGKVPYEAVHTGRYIYIETKGD
ncbi:MAG: sulfatase family protein, partial [Candidatus Binatia bacterium]